MCPDYKKCVLNEKCKVENDCLNPDYWAHYWRLKARGIQKKFQPNGITASRRFGAKASEISLQETFCCYCEEEIVTMGNLTKEHLVPVSKGGTNRKVNLRNCCIRCNSARACKTYPEWIRELTIRLKFDTEKGERYNLMLKQQANAEKCLAYVKEHGLLLARSQKLYDYHILYY